MMVAYSFDLWQKDAFFSAAEEVQDSADIMESAFRRWVRHKTERLRPEELDELSRELQTTLGTAKWQLEEFERAVRLSYGNRSDEITTARHQQFVGAIQNQICQVEAALREFFNEETKQPLRWVKLNKVECDDLAAFLSGKVHTSKDQSVVLESSTKISQVTKCNMKDEMYTENGFEDIMSVDAKQISGTKDDINCRGDRSNNTWRTWSSPNFGALKIVVEDQDDQNKTLLPTNEATPKEKGSRPVLWKPNYGEPSKGNGGTNSFNQLLGHVSGLQRQLRRSHQQQFRFSVQFTLVLVLALFLIVPFLLYSP